jgi:hypothetical protein
VIRELAKSLGSLTASPINAALNEAHRMARRHLEDGGAAVGSGGRDGGHDFPLPLDVDPKAVAVAIEAKLGGAGSQSRAGDASRSLLESDTDGRLVIPGEHVQRLGEGDFDRGKRFLDRVVNEIRRQRVLMAARQAASMAR